MSKLFLMLSVVLIGVAVYAAYDAFTQPRPPKTSLAPLTDTATAQMQDLHSDIHPAAGHAADAHAQEATDKILDSLGIPPSQ